MSRLTPYAGSSLARLCELLVTANNIDLKYGTDYVFRDMQSIPTETTGENTQIVFVPLVWDGKFAEQEIKYTRLNLDALTRLPAGSIQPVKLQYFPFQMGDVINEINEALGLNLTADEVHNDAVSGTDLHYVLRINEDNSLAWLGSIELEIDVFGKTHLRVPINRPVLGQIENPQSYDTSLAEYDAHTQLFELLRRVNPAATQITDSDVSFGNLVPISPATHAGMDTKFIVTAKPTSPTYIGAVELYYKRNPLQDFIGWGPLLSELPFTKKLIVDFLNSFGAQLQDSDVVDMMLPDGLQIGDTGTIVVRTSDSSIAWSGERELPYVFGLPLFVNELHHIVNVTMPTPGYFI